MRAILSPAAPPAEMTEALHRMRLLPENARATGERLTGGVSSDIWRIDLETGPVCVKRALAKLRVAADWRAPVARNQYEARWMEVAAHAAPNHVPRLLGQDTASGALAMEYLPPEHFPLWKTQLRDGHADPGFAAAVATALVQIHAVTAADPSLAAQFPTDEIFYDIRLHPYLVATAAGHPDRAQPLLALVATTRSNRKALVHGDVSPKNILAGPNGPVFLDAECAWWGDPAFDLAFCLNHLLLKCLWTPGSAEGFLACYAEFAHAYRAGIAWEPVEKLESRAAHLLPGLLLARVDGKSPVEYLSESDQNRVRQVARALLAHPVETLAAVAEAWSQP